MIFCYLKGCRQVICVAVLRGASIHDLLSSLFALLFSNRLNGKNLCWRERITKNFVRITQIFNFIFKWKHLTPLFIISFENRSFHPNLKLGMSFAFYITIKPSHNTFVYVYQKFSAKFWSSWKFVGNILS